MDAITEYNQLSQRVHFLRAHIYDNDDYPKELKALMPKYLQLKEIVQPTFDHSAMSAKFS